MIRPSSAGFPLQKVEVCRARRSLFLLPGHDNVPHCSLSPVAPIVPVCVAALSEAERVSFCACVVGLRASWPSRNWRAPFIGAGHLAWRPGCCCSRLPFGSAS